MKAVPSAGAITADGGQTGFGLGSGYQNQLRGELEAGRLIRLAAITVEFALIVGAIRLLNLESNAFEEVLTLALGGFLVNHFLPATWRQGFFAALSVVSVLLVFGWPEGGKLLAMGGLLIALCHLPVAFWVRVTLIVLVAAGMAVARSGWLPTDAAVPSAIWPILGAMFMFRLIVYLYDLANKAAPFSVGRAVSYFFMMPNVCFPLFPVVDYKTLQRSAYNDDPLRLYHTGARWMLRGLVHLALYKLVYLLLVIDPTQVSNGTGAARYMVSTYLLYLKISGLFHLIVGLLRMYGFGLAETHHLYLFAYSFTDFWRRINIYWKDFIQKIVFNPVYFRSRGLGGTGALLFATLVAFVATWLFHSYQWFWIRGTFPIVWSDLVFWLGLGLVVAINVLLETRGGRRRSLGLDARKFREDVVLGLKIAGTFACICVLWAVWSTPDTEELGFVWRAVLNSGAADIAVLIGVPFGIGALGVLLGGRKREGSVAAARAAEPDGVFWRQVAIVGSGASAFILVAMWPGLLSPISPQLANTVHDITRRAGLNSADAERLQRGYYEDLGDVTRFNSELWTVYGGRPPGWGQGEQGRLREDAVRMELIPSTATEFKGAIRTVNSHGMRDQEYTVAPHTSTFRIALVGSSHDMGSGVEDDQTYENLIEDRLNRELGDRTGLAFEFLNFSNGGYTPIQKLATLEKRMLAFQPDVVLYAATSHELRLVFKAEQLQHMAQYELLGEFPDVLEAMRRAGVTTKADEIAMHSRTVESKLMPYSKETFTTLLRSFRELAGGAGARTAMVLLELPADTEESLRVFDDLTAIGAAVEVPILDLRGAYSGIRDRSSLWIAPWDDHVNAGGHVMLADHLYSLLVERGLVPTERGPGDSEYRP